ncbi:MAG: pitrilysin family protein, partial [Dehalococcoidia bacterium]
MPHTRSVSICVFIGAGSRYEEDASAGISHFLEHMLFKGTPKRPSSADISGVIENVGGMMNGSTDRELSSYWCKVAQPHFHKALDVLVDMIRDPIMDPEEVEKERTVIQQELSMTNDYPSYRVEILSDEMLWPDQPMGRDIGGSRESVQRIATETLSDWFRSQYTPSNVVISIAGRVRHNEVLEALGPLVKGWPQGTPKTWRPATHQDRRVPQVRTEQRRTEQAHVCLSLPGISNRHPDRYALDMMSTVLGEGMGSRLFLEIREKRGLAYDIHSMVTHFRDTGSIVVYFGVDPKKARRTAQTILGEFRRMKAGVPEEELRRAKELAKGRLLLRMED